MNQHLALILADESKKSGPIGFAVILILCVACYFLFKSMSKHMRKVREEFPQAGSGPAGSSAAPALGPGETTAAATGTEATGTEATGTGETDAADVESDVADAADAEAAGALTAVADDGSSGAEASPAGTASRTGARPGHAKAKVRADVRRSTPPTS